MVLLEAALAIPLLLLVAIAGLAVVRLGVTELAVVDAARDAAIAAGRGTDARAVVADVHARLPGAQVEQRRERGTVTVTVATRTTVVPMVGHLSIGHEATAVAAVEPGV